MTDSCQPRQGGTRLRRTTSGSSAKKYWEASGNGLAVVNERVTFVAGMRIVQAEHWCPGQMRRWI